MSSPSPLPKKAPAYRTGISQDRRYNPTQTSALHSGPRSTDYCTFLSWDSNSGPHNSGQVNLLSQGALTQAHSGRQFNPRNSHGIRLRPVSDLCQNLDSELVDAHILTFPTSGCLSRVIQVWSFQCRAIQMLRRCKISYRIHPYKMLIALGTGHDEGREHCLQLISGRQISEPDIFHRSLVVCGYSGVWAQLAYLSCFSSYRKRQDCLIRTWDHSDA